MTNVQQIAVVVAGFRVLYDKPPLEVAVLKAYSLELGSHTPEQVHNAFRCYMTGGSGGFWPNPGQIVAEIIREATAGDVIPSAAFDQIITAYKRHAACRDDRDKLEAMRENLPAIVYEAMCLHGGWQFFAYLAEKNYGYERNRIAETTSDLLAQSEVRTRETLLSIGRAGSGALEIERDA